MKKRTTAITAIVTLSMVLLAACGGGGKPKQAIKSVATTTTTAVETSVVTEATTTTAAAAPVVGPPATTAKPKTVVTAPPVGADPNAIIRVGQDLVNGLGSYFDPSRYNSFPENFINLMYDSMVHYSSRGYEPGLATEWKFPNARTVELTLRHDVKFQDGTPFNADAVKFSWDRVIARPSSQMTKVAGIAAMDSVESIGDDKVIVHLKSDIAGDWRDRLLYSSAAGLGVVSPTVAKAIGDAKMNETPVNAGAGPYAFKSHQPGQKLELRKWDGYWNKDGQVLGGVDFIHVQAGAPRVTALAGGVIDYAIVNPADVKGLRGRGIDVEEILPELPTSFYQFCTNKAPFNNLEARKAIAYALNRDDYIKSAYQGFGKANAQFLSAANDWFQSVPTPYGYDLDKAKASLAAAGVAPGTKITFITNSTPLEAAIAQTFQDQMKAIGLDVEIYQSQNSFTDIQKVDWNVYSGGGSIPTSVSAFIINGGVGNPCKYDNPGVASTYLRTQNPQATQAEMKAAWVDFQNAVYTDLPFVGIANPVRLVAHTKKVKGFSGDTNDGYLPSWHFYMTK
ncbi:MAG: peptide/nickel transport system substrate-binding protein [Actinomycetota bacterium]|jgi:peptide/nickel transport system substrate-binding protein|nr:peptide/nickel transport system substrate-binding protein [Actinomycetota bacterium]